ncbi:hypothetical protein O0I10_001346 [Lichtheimia ornata]|uniref:Programmed cell death protein 2 C-terminal domain-containing protein n=1 Tax=Lichtheimia ornata TaxID=688661 RepID=A0AAD7Y3N8_9FUNG|nr:uncharacterized protein O0I10_001346 [Lichtheimia ornata]KAJ8663169.1 hypothetical protein O0I10_001346 [Lichtheimia ornata]
MGNQRKKAPKHKDPVLLGLPDGAIESSDDVDAYITKIGGVPVWLDAEKLPSPKVLECGNCRRPMYLIFQGYVPLADSPYHRVIYVWGCNQRLCMRKEGSFSVLRSHLVDPEYLAAQKKKEEEKRKKEQRKKQQQASPFGAPAGFQLGDLWGASSPSTTPVTTSFASVASKASASAQPPSSSSNSLADAMSKMNLDDDTTTQHVIPPESIVSFPAENLWITEEDLNNMASFGIDMSRYQEYVDMQNALLESAAADEEWSGETYEKQTLPKGVDKQFRKFMERVECEPSQCVRYEWAGVPLLYHQLQQPLSSLAGRCTHCGSPRVFEMQLMPNVLSVLPVAEYASSNTSSSATGDELKAWDVGMEFGTVMVFVCEKDCHPGDVESPSHVREHVVVQYEKD